MAHVHQLALARRAQDVVDARWQIVNAQLVEAAPRNKCHYLKLPIRLASFGGWLSGLAQICVHSCTCELEEIYSTANVLLTSLKNSDAGGNRNDPTAKQIRSQWISRDPQLDGD